MTIQLTQLITQTCYGACQCATEHAVNGWTDIAGNRVRQTVCIECGETTTEIVPPPAEPK